ncbi:unnamed protein product [Phytomonas sp. EM1]|nr:unnamed protein product [Phytomonas sp. EM1]|eukprot:CCW64458.1 unnamed protein product [Phytomonas sp. isolate EM1]
MYRQNIPNYRRPPHYNPNYNPAWKGLQPCFPQFNRNHCLGSGGNARGGRNNIRLGNNEAQRGRTPCKEKWWAFVTNLIKWVNSPRDFNLDSEDDVKEAVPVKPIFLAKAQARCHPTSPRGRQREQPNCGRQQAIAHPTPLENRSFASYYDGIYEFGEIKLKESPLAQVESMPVMDQKSLTCPVSGPTPGLNDPSDDFFSDARKGSVAQDLTNVMPCFRTGNDLHAFLGNSNERGRGESDACNPSESIPQMRSEEHSRTSPLFGSSINGVPDFLDVASKEPKNDDGMRERSSFRFEGKPNNKDAPFLEEKGLSYQDKKEVHKLHSSYNLGQSFTYLNDNIEAGYTTIQALQSAMDQASTNGLYEEGGTKPSMSSNKDNESENPRGGTLGVSAPGNITPSAMALRSRSTMYVDKNLNNGILDFRTNKESFCGVPNYDFAGDFGYDGLQTVPQELKSVVSQVGNSSSGFPLHTARPSTNALTSYTIQGSFVLPLKASDLSCVQPPDKSMKQEANEAFGNPLDGRHYDFGTGDGIHTQSLSTSSISTSDLRSKKRVETASIPHPVVPAKDSGSSRFIDSKFTSTAEDIDEIAKPYACKENLLDKNLKPKVMMSKTTSEAPNIRGSLEAKPYSIPTREAVIPKGNPNTSEAPRTKDYLAFISKLPSSSDNVKVKRGSIVECGNNSASGMTNCKNDSMLTSESKNMDYSNVTRPDVKDKSPDNLSKMPYSALLPVLLYEITKVNRQFAEPHKTSNLEEQIHTPSVNIKSTQVPSPPTLKNEGHSNDKEAPKQTRRSPLLPAFRKDNRSK